MLRSLLLVAAVALAACSKAPAPATAAVAITAPAGTYALDANHASLSFKVSHLGIAPYVARFAALDATLTLDPAALTKSSLTFTVKPASVRTDYSGDYKAGHKDSSFNTWDEDLGQSDKWLNGKTHVDASFRSTSITEKAPGKLSVSGDLTLLGKTQPAVFDVTVTGSTAKHPFTQNGAIGFSASTTIKRSAFGMTYLLQPPLIGDDVGIEFNGEFHQKPAA